MWQLVCGIWYVGVAFGYVSLGSSLAFYSGLAIAPVITLLHRCAASILLSALFSRNKNTDTTALLRYSSTQQEGVLKKILLLNDKKEYHSYVYEARLAYAPD